MSRSVSLLGKARHRLAAKADRKNGQVRRPARPSKKEAYSMSATTKAHRPVATKRRLIINPPLSTWEQALVWLMVLIVCVIGWKMYGLYELGLVR